MSLADTQSPPGPTLSDLGEEPDTDAGGDYEELDYPDPIEHGFGIEAVINDLGHEQGSAYDRFFQAWRKQVGGRDKEPYVVLEDVHRRWDWLHDDYPAHLVFLSKGWKAGENAVDGEVKKQYYEYSLQVMRYDTDSGELSANMESPMRAPVSCQIYIQPQDETLQMNSGDTITCHYGEGTKFRTQTTYAGPSEALTRTVEVTSAALEALGKDAPAWESMNRQSWRIWKGEVHHRIDESLMKVAAQKIRSARTLVEHGGEGDSEGGGRYQGGQHVEERTVSDMWDRIGFSGYAARDGYELGLKVYRVSGQPADERLRHPKLEAFFAGTGNDTRLPHADEWTVLRATLRQLASAMAIRSGVALADLREDDYYQPMDREMIDIMVPQGWRRAMKEANEERERRILKTTYESLSPAKWDVLWTIYATEGCTYETLTDLTGFSKDYVREIVAALEEKDILRRVTYPRLVVYHNEELRLNAREKLQEVHPDRGLDAIREEAKERRQDRRELRQEREEDEDDPSGSEDDSASEDVDSGEEPASSTDPATWRYFEDVSLDGRQLGRALDEGYIEPDHVRIRTDPYTFVGPPDN